jgi:hypothetical protein
LRGYLAVVPFWLLCETVSTVLEIVSLSQGYRVAPLLDAPYRSRSLAEFWGRRWNRSAAPSLRRVLFMPLASHPHLALIVPFLVSGIVHDLVINVPAAIACDVNLLGSMTGYFLIQALGVWVDRLWFERGWVRRTLLWTVVLMPAPLIMNESMLRILLWR